ncbi:MAG: nitroreductase family protein [Lachnospiraceae bacterium]|nr:nitroreductase family protein [Lachnospiraceae bacterium]
MNFMELAQNRYSIRNFSSKAIEKDKLAKILKAGQVAPTAGNYQPQKVYVVQSEEGLEKLRSLIKCHYGAPTVLIIAYDKSKDWKNPNQEGVHSGEQDTSIVATHMMLEAWELGIGSCWVNFFSPSQVAEEFGFPENITPVLMLPIGYAAEETKPAAWHEQSKELCEIIEYL